MHNPPLAVTPAAPADDATILALIRAQSPVGLAQLYERYGGLIYSIALRVVRDRGAAEEITQEVFVRCWAGVERDVPAQGSLSAWLVTITYHCAIDTLRSQRGQARLHEQPVDSVPSLPAYDPGFDATLLRDELRAALCTLPMAQREAIELIFWGGLTHREAAAQFGVPLGTLHTRVRLAIDTLREVYGRVFGEQERHAGG